MARKIIAAQFDRLPQNAVHLHELPLHRPLSREAQQILHDIFGPLRLLQNNLQIFPRRNRYLGILQQQIRKTQYRRQRVIHFMRHARDQPPNRRHLFAVCQLGLQQCRVRDVRHHHNNAVHGILLISHRAQADREMPHRSVAAPHPQFQILHLMPIRCSFQRRIEIFPVRSLHPVHQPVPDQFAFLVTRFIAPPVRVANQPRRIQHQNHALRGIQNLLIEIPFPLQLRLKRFLLCYVQHQPANLRNTPPRIAHRSDILQRVQQRPILAPQRLLVIPQNSTLRQCPQKFFPHFRRRIQMRAHVRAQQFLPRRVSQHSHHRVIHIQESPVRRRKKQSFLNAVKQLSILSFCFPPVGNVLQNVNRSRIVI